MNPLVHDLTTRFGELRETHISWVFLGADRVLKIKKPVALGFLDFTSLAARKAACEAELLLNRRLAPDVYLRLVPITRDATGVHLPEGPGEPVEWAVEMLRLPDDDAAQARLFAGRLTREHVLALGERLARFHAEARADAETARFGDPSVIRGNVLENFAQTEQSAPAHLSAEQVAEIERYQLDFLDTHAELLEQRARAGHVRDGHGDLRLEHVYIDDGGDLRIIDCIEFNDRFRYADVCADLAFLSMDLVWHERPELAEALLASYARAANDFELYRLVDFYESYRAYVRAKVESFVEEDAGLSVPARERTAASARKHYLLALSCGREPLQRAFLCAVGGVIASGKTTLAERLGAQLGVPVVDADRTRKHLAQAAPTEVLGTEAFAGAYSATASEHVYAELRARADAVLFSGRPVVVDASLRSRAEREALRALAERHAVPFRFVEVCAPREVCRARLAARAAHANVSDARADLLDAFVASYERVDELRADEHVVVDSTRDPSSNLRDVLARLLDGPLD